MGTVNRVILVGHLGADAELHTVSSTSVSNFRLATTERFMNKTTGVKAETTEWHRVAFWGKGADAINQYLVKGKQVYVEGRLESKKWTGKDGVEHTSVTVRADRVTLLSSAGQGGDASAPSRKKAPAASASSATTAPTVDPDDVEDDSIPF